MREPTLPHLPLLMCTDQHLASRHGTAEQNIPVCLIFGKVGVRVVVFDRAFEQPSRAGQAAPLMADRRQDDPIHRNCVPDVLILATIEGTGPLRGFQSNPMDASPCHLSFDA